MVYSECMVVLATFECRSTFGAFFHSLSSAPDARLYRFDDSQTPGAFVSTWYTPDK